MQAATHLALTGAVMNDWREHADLSYYGVLSLVKDGRRDEALALYTEALTRFDGMGLVSHFSAILETTRMSVLLTTRKNDNCFFS